MAKIEIYCDECRQDLLVNKSVINKNNRFTVLGGIWIDGNVREDFKSNISNLRKKYHIYGEIKWKKVSNNKLEFYKEIIKIFFEFTNISFRAVVIDSEVFDIYKYHNNSGELGFYKCYYQLLKEWIFRDNEYNIFLDYRKDKSRRRVNDLKKCINNYLNNDAVKNIQFINSKESILLQLEDVIMGCIGYKYNYGYKGKSKAKNTIIEEIEKYFIIKETSSSKKKFNIFKINLRKSDNKNV
ncbi:MAG: DUF3800 domain-containing protein [Bacilli bacterium]|nr:DUF3800 domain-containing protein [Bacilli bacterium]